MPSPELELVTEPLGGSPLARAALDGAAGGSWYPRAPATPDEWREHMRKTRRSVPEGWYEHLADAFGGHANVPERLTATIRAGGVLVTSGQQPGLFGGPVYTWAKAISALAPADELEAVTGVPAAPVFWAATDDADFTEASWTMIALPGGVRRLVLPAAVQEGVPMSETPLGDVSGHLAALAEAAGSAADPTPLAAARSAYSNDATVGSAFVALLRMLLNPLGIAVLDASHPAVPSASYSLLGKALDLAPDIALTLQRRQAAMRDAGFQPQVPEVPGLSLVFERRDHIKRRVPIGTRAAGIRGSDTVLSPNVLLRPVVERSLMPTVAYMAGPGELAYFAQVSAVAEALGAPWPLALPRWSVTILEPHVREILDRYGLQREELAIPDQAETRLAREAWPQRIEEAVRAFRATLESCGQELRSVVAAEAADVPPRAVEGVTRTVAWRLARLERRITAAVKRRETQLMRDMGTARGALYPGGTRQERALNLLPLLGRHGTGMLGRMREAARRYARGLASRDAGVPSR